MTKAIVGYNGDATLRTRFLRQMSAHARADAVMQGNYGRMIDDSWKGCAVACGLRSLDKIDGVYSKEKDATGEYGDHVKLAKRLGIPLELAYLEDRIFEKLPKAQALAWPQRFAKAIPVGADLSLVWPRFAVFILSDETHGVQRFASERGKAAIAQVVALFERRLAGEHVSLEEWSSARSAAYDAAAAAAAYAAYDAYDAAADAAADAAYAAAYAAAAAADAAAAYAAAYATRSKHFSVMADKLIELMEACDG